MVVPKLTEGSLIDFGLKQTFNANFRSDYYKRTIYPPINPIFLPALPTWINKFVGHGYCKNEKALNKGLSTEC